MKVLARREKVKQLVVRGLTILEISEALSVSPATIKRDLSVIRQEFKELANNRAFEEVLTDFLMNYDAVFREAWKTYFSTQNENVKLGALNLVTKIFDNKIKILQSLGVIKEEPVKIEHSLVFDRIAEFKRSENE